MFVGRSEELGLLEKMYAKKIFELGTCERWI